MKPAIVLSTHTMGLSAGRALSMNNVPVTGVCYDKHDIGPVSRHFSKIIEAPHPEREQAQFIDLLLDLPRQNPEYDGAFLLPTSDASLNTISRHKAQLAEHFVVACSDWEVTQQFLDKQYTYSLAEKVNVPVPKTLTPCSLDEAREYAQQVTYPCIVKPTLSHLFYARFGCKMVEVHNAEALCSTYQKAADEGLEVMLQEIIPGPDSNGVNYNAYIWDGEVRVEFTGKKVRSSPPRFGSPSVVISKHIPEVMEHGRNILKAMNFDGYACTEFKYDDRDGTYKLIEVNGRHNLSSLLAVRCGLNFPWLHYRHLMLGEVPTATEYELDIYWVDILRDLAYIPYYIKRREFSPIKFFTPYFRPNIYANFDIKDIRPFLKGLQMLGGQARRKIYGVRTTRKA